MQTAGIWRFRPLIHFGKMLRNNRFPDPQYTLFAALLILSVALHALVLSQLNWQIQVPEETEVVFEVELLEPPPETPPPQPIKPTPPVIKPEPPQKKELEKPELLEKKTAPPPETGKPEPAQKPSPKPEPKPVPKPPPKPLLQIQSDIGQSADLTESDIPRAERVPETPSAAPLLNNIKIPEAQSEVRQVIPKRQAPAPRLSYDPEQEKRIPRQEIPDSGEIAGDRQKSDLKSEIRQQKETVRYRIVERTGTGESAGTGTQATGDSMIEGELRQRKVIYKPDPPDLNLEKDVTITLKFTVLPNGEVDRIFPFRKAEPELEQLAMKLLRQYRFEPLFENDAIQQGIIHFTIHRSK